MKKQYTAPQMEEIALSTLTLLALSGGEQVDMGVFPESEKDGGSALSNPFNPFRGWGF